MNAVRITETAPRTWGVWYRGEPRGYVTQQGDDSFIAQASPWSKSLGVRYDRADAVVLLLRGTGEKRGMLR